MIKIFKVLFLVSLIALGLNASVKRISNDYVQISSGNTTYVGNDLNQTYSINPLMITTASAIVLIDQGGSNTIELVDGLTISSSMVVSDEILLTLGNGSTIDVREANHFTFDVGANQSQGITGTRQSFSEFVTTTLGLNFVPTLGQAPVRGESVKISDQNRQYYLHKNISVTLFWAGEKASEENTNIPNISSAWDDMWMQNYGGIDTPDDRDGYNPSSFIPDENPFYFALPYNDYDINGNKKTDGYCKSTCKNRWIKIVKGDSVAYAQWEDVGPFGENDVDYVFGTSTPQNQINNSAGLDVSPTLRDYLHLNDIDTVSWTFVDEGDVEDGPWKDIVTTSGINWIDWYKPTLHTSWQWQLQGDIDTSYDVDLYDIDLFDSNQSLIDSLKASGKKVICYFSAGSAEDWRDDFDDFPQEALGDNMDGWAGERWLDINNDALKPIMKARLDLAKEKGCDGVEPDNMDNYTNATGFQLSADNQLAYNKFIAKEAHKRGLSVGLKNDLNQITELEPFFDFSINEQCHYYDECYMLQAFTDANKPIFNAEYAQKYIDNTDGARDDICLDSANRGIQTLILPLDLDGSFRYTCN